MLLESDSSTVDMMIEQKRRVSGVPQGSEVEMEQITTRFVAAARGFSGQEHDPVRIWESGIRRAVSRRTGRGAEREQDRRMRFAEEEQAKESRAQRTDMQDVMNGPEEK